MINNGKHTIMLPGPSYLCIEPRHTQQRVAEYDTIQRKHQREHDRRAPMRTKRESFQEALAERRQGQCAHREVAVVENHSLLRVRNRILKQVRDTPSVERR